VVISDRVGFRRPSQAIYELTTSKIGLPPDDCLFVNDTEASHPTARELGMGTLFFIGADGDSAGIGGHRHRLDDAARRECRTGADDVTYRL
jgi:FMN phosphatase YigB (HAD superfamily)